jgi:hypothetical protein
MTKLKKISKEAILNSSLWKPPDKPLEIVSNTDSWFDIKQMEENNNTERWSVTTTNIRSYPIMLKPTIRQRQMLLSWNEIYRLSSLVKYK